ncbi:MAG TPA: tRNA (adenosine(37)-N6)-dimethylallyltransferase MiaA [Rhabdochlamydiaceae bacterium]|nr:tRNA (adenosine(37)-N6)-dimethylallyltransferase MiaA [Rhabdochlamydiaceae bacterium]
MSPGLTLEEKEVQDLFGIPLPLKMKTPSRSKKKKVIVISGPTGVGKTELSVKIAQVIGGEVVSADSMQVYKGMDIGTAKASTTQRSIVPHHLIDCRDLDKTFNVVEFYEAANKAIHEILIKGHVPVVVGGTGFYIHALLYGPPSGPPSAPEVRTKLEQEMQHQGPAALYERLRNLDPDYATTITQRDKHKIIRALEIISITNQKVSKFSKASSDRNDNYDFRCWFIYMPKEVLYPRIEMRCDTMIANGFIDEVRTLEKNGLRQNVSAAQAIGYRQCLEFLDSEQTQQDWERFVFSFKQASRRYAKRQFTWFRREPLFRWLNMDSTPFEKVVEIILQDYELSF